MTKKETYVPNRHPKNTAKIFKDLDDDADVTRSQCQFFEDVWDFWEMPKGTIYTFLGFKRVSDGKWIDKAIKIKNSAFSTELFDLLTQFNRWDYDQYFCPNAFSKPRRKQRYALPTRFGWCDIDESDPDAYDPWPSLVWETSPDRYQALWSWDKYHEPDEAEGFSKALAYRHGGDRNGWTITKMLRLMGSVNHKPKYDEPFVHTVACDWTEICARPLVLKRDQAKVSGPLPEVDVNPAKFNAAEVVKKYRGQLHPKARTLMRNRKAYEENKSAQIFHMIAALYEAGACFDEIASVIWPNPYFVEKHGHDIGKLNEEIARVVGKLEVSK